MDVEGVVVLCGSTSVTEVVISKESSWGRNGCVCSVYAGAGSECGPSNGAAAMAQISFLGWP